VDGSVPTGRTESEWLTLGEAARLLGVDATTLRGWANSGKIRVFRTPGGHRRFNARDLSTVLEAAPPVSGRLGDVRTRSSPREWMASRPWYGRVNEDHLARARGQCTQLMQTLTAYLEESGDRQRRTAEGRSLGAGLGREVARWGLTPGQSTEVFVHFKMMVTDALATPPLGTSGQVRSMRDADVFLGEVLQAMMEGYEQERA
jgi:excisionase family DNA binding protein